MVKMRKMMLSLTVIVLLLITAAAFTACSSGPTLTGEMDDEGKEVTYTANKADKDDFVLSGTLIVGEDEQIVIDSELEKGSMQFEFIKNDGMDDTEEVPDVEGMDATYTAYVSEIESQAVQFGAGEYMIRATVTEKGTTGEVDIEVKGFGED